MRVWTSPARRVAATRPLRTHLSGSSAAVLVAVRLVLGLFATGHTDHGVGAEAEKSEAKPATLADVAAAGPESAGTNLTTKSSSAAPTTDRRSTKAVAMKSGNKTESKSDNAAKPLALDYPSFRMISERNIFNADRTRRSSRSSSSGPRTPAVQVTSVSLVGYLGSQQGDRVFFDGNTSAYRKAIKIGETLGDFKLSAASPTGVVLETGERKFSLKIGEQLRREESGPWKAAEGSTTTASNSTNSIPETAETTAADGDEAAPAESAGGNNAAVDDVLARLLKKRQQEENK